MSFALTLNELVTLESRTTGQDDIGGALTTWQSVESDVWANIKYLNGVQAIKADAQASLTKVSIRLRYREDVRAGMRATSGGKVFDIEGVLPDSKRLFVDLVCKVTQ